MMRIAHLQVGRANYNSAGLYCGLHQVRLYIFMMIVLNIFFFAME